MLRPLAAEKWDYGSAAHLLNRAGFGGPPGEIEALVALGPEQAVDRLVNYEEIPDLTPAPEWAKPDPERARQLAGAQRLSVEERQKLQREEQQRQRERLAELRGWWLQRMARGARPLQEKMVLFWHGHFATSFEKVRDATLMWRQNETFRRLATGNWLELLIETAKDPAMLIWLDQAQSRKERPNENFAREVMELFTLGEGEFTEEDVAQGARALTGWTFDRAGQRFVNRPTWHDTGHKVIFGKEGNFDGEDFLELIVARPAAGRFITRKLWRFFAGTEPSEELAAALASLFRRSGNEFKPLLRAIFRSEEFYSPRVRRNQVKSPVQWLIGSVRMLERELPPPEVCAAMLRTMGQDLFAPPNVKGWEEGVGWITTNTLMARYNQAAVLVYGEPDGVAGRAPAAQTARGAGAKRKGGAGQPGGAAATSPEAPGARPAAGGVEVKRILSDAQRSSKEELIGALEQRLLQARLKPEHRRVLREYLDSQGALDEAGILNAIRLVMSTPEYQVA
ncbi:MAG TPA: DUF1800 domain-containing protein [Candidatus Paceibacterota bacterium]|nr:DUF1800 domain-containing protein [Candidatus Paceibacterota bacterium]